MVLAVATTLSRRRSPSARAARRPAPGETRSHYLTSVDTGLLSRTGTADADRRHRPGAGPGAGGARRRQPGRGRRHRTAARHPRPHAPADVAKGVSRRTGRRGSRRRARRWCWSSAPPTTGSTRPAGTRPPGRTWSRRSRPRCRASTSEAGSTPSRSTTPPSRRGPGSRPTTRAAPARTSTSAAAPARRLPRPAGQRLDARGRLRGRGRRRPRGRAAGDLRDEGRQRAGLGAGRRVRPDSSTRTPPMRVVGALTELGRVRRATQALVPRHRQLAGAGPGPADGVAADHRGPALLDRHLLPAGAGTQARTRGAATAAHRRPRRARPGRGLHDAARSALGLVQPVSPRTRNTTPIRTKTTPPTRVRAGPRGGVGASPGLPPALRPRAAGDNQTMEPNAVHLRGAAVGPRCSENSPRPGPCASGCHRAGPVGRENVSATCCPRMPDDRLTNSTNYVGFIGNVRMPHVRTGGASSRHAPYTHPLDRTAGRSRLVAGPVRLRQQLVGRDADRRRRRATAAARPSSRSSPTPPRRPPTTGSSRPSRRRRQGKNITFTESLRRLRRPEPRRGAGLSRRHRGLLARARTSTRLVKDKHRRRRLEHRRHKGMVTDSVVVLVVRKGNPKDIKTVGRPDQARHPGHHPQPVHVRRRPLERHGRVRRSSNVGKDDAAGVSYLNTLFKNVPVQDGSARAPAADLRRRQGRRDDRLRERGHLRPAEGAGRRLRRPRPDHPHREPGRRD